MKEDLENLSEEIRQAEEKKTALEHQLARLQQRERHLRKKPDRERTHRLIQYGAAFEYHIKGLQALNDSEIFYLVQHILTIPGVCAYIEDVLKEKQKEDC